MLSVFFGLCSVGVCVVCVVCFCCCLFNVLCV